MYNAYLLKMIWSVYEKHVSLRQGSKKMLSTDDSRKVYGTNNFSFYDSRHTNILIYTYTKYKVLNMLPNLLS